MNTRWISELVGLNFLALADVVIDIRQEWQISGPDLQIPLYQQVVKFQALLPANTSGLIDRSCDLRWKAVKLLERQKAVANVTLYAGSHRWESQIQLRVNERRFADVADAIDQEASRRAAQTRDDDSPAPSATELTELLAPDKVTLKWLFERVPVKLWISAAAIIVAVFYLGARLSDIWFVRTLLRLPSPVVDYSRLPGTLSAVTGDLILQSRGSPTSPVRVNVELAATGGNVILQRDAKITEVSLNRSLFNNSGGQGVAPQLLSITPYPPVLSPGAEGAVSIDFRPSSIVVSRAAFSSAPPNELTRAGHIKLALKYETMGEERFLELVIPVFIQS